METAETLPYLGGYSCRHLMAMLVLVQRVLLPLCSSSFSKHPPIPCGGVSSQKRAPICASFASIRFTRASLTATHVGMSVQEMWNLVQANPSQSKPILTCQAFFSHLFLEKFPFGSTPT